VSVVVIGSDPGALAIAAELARSGLPVRLAELPENAVSLESVREAGGVTVVSGWYGSRTEPVAVAENLVEAVRGAELVFVVTACFAQRSIVEAIAPALADGQALCFFNGAGGALVARQVLAAVGKQIPVGEANTLPYIVRPAGPGAVQADRKPGGVLFAAIPSAATPALLGRLQAVWPFIEAAESVWETALINYGAVDHVATTLANLGTLEGRVGGMLLWGEGATPGVTRLLEAVDGELFAIRKALGLGDQRRYRDFLIEQGMAPDVGPALYDVLRASLLVSVPIPSGPRALETRFIHDDIPYPLVLAASVGDEVGVETPVIDGLIAIGSALVGRDFRAEGRTLASLGLAGQGAAGLRRFAETGEPGTPRGS
jgi:opine dehydrogenase